MTNTGDMVAQKDCRKKIIANAIVGQAISKSCERCQHGPCRDKNYQSTREEIAILIAEKNTEVAKQEQAVKTLLDEIIALESVIGILDKKAEADKKSAENELTVAKKNKIIGYQFQIDKRPASAIVDTWESAANIAVTEGYATKVYSAYGPMKYIFDTTQGVSVETIYID